ncbi:MAG TPA: pseudouridine synthase [Candidatus Saccharimonadia bacterium]|nr:pseudouridine synthase [Candidatus Saccharimonadia bacterium]
MRINKFVAQASGLSRRAADRAIEEGRVKVNGQSADIGVEISEGDSVTFDGQSLSLPTETTTIMLNKPTGYVSSRQGQGNRTIYELLPPQYRNLKPVGRLDKDSSGLILLTDDGELANQLTHPSYGKTKIYEITLDKPLEPLHRQMISDHGVRLDDGPSKLALEKLQANGLEWRVTMTEGRNRQIRRTFAALGYDVDKLHRINFGNYTLGTLKEGLYLKFD